MKEIKGYFKVNFTVYHRSSVVASSDMHFDNGTTNDEIREELKKYEEEVISNISSSWERA